MGWTIGAKYKNPETNCCVCGGGETKDSNDAKTESSTPTPSTSTTADVFIGVVDEKSEPVENIDKAETGPEEQGPKEESKGKEDEEEGEDTKTESSTPQTYTYTRLSGDCRGNNIQKGQKMTLEQCSTQCNELENCAGYSWANRKQKCVLKSKSCKKKVGRCRSRWCFYRKDAVTEVSLAQTANEKAATERTENAHCSAFIALTGCDNLKEMCPCSCASSKDENKNTYVALDRGQVCPKGTLLSSREECEQALQVLGLDATGRPWSGNHGGIPPSCSYKTQYRELHWNDNMYSTRGRRDLQPICLGAATDIIKAEEERKKEEQKK